MALNVTPQQQETIAALYAAFWNRAPDSEGFGNYCTLLASGAMTVQQIADEMRASAEGRAAYQLWSTNEELVNEVYQNLFDRAPDASGAAAWLAWLNTPGHTFPQLVVAMADAALNANGIDGQLVDNKIAVGIYVATVLESNNALVTTTAFQGLTYENSSVAEVELRLYEIQNTYTLTSEPDTATAVNFYGPKAYTPGGNDLVNTLQNEDVLTGDTSGPTGTYLYADIGNVNDSGYHIIAPSITDVDTIDIAFTSTADCMTLDFQDIVGTEEANMTRISANLRQSFTNLDSDVVTLGIADTSEAARATITYLNSELAAANNAVTVNLDNVSLSEQDPAEDRGALEILATTARGSELQHQIETYNINAIGGASTVATFDSGVSSFDDLVTGERPVTVNIDAEAALAIGTLRWMGNRVETNSANGYQNVADHVVGVNGLGFVRPDQITEVTVTGSDDVTLANVGTWETEADSDDDIDFTLDASLQTGNLTADISNAAASVDASFTGGFGSDRFYVSGGYTVCASIATASAASVLSSISGGALEDSLTVQAGGADIDLLDGTGVEDLNLVQAYNTDGTGLWNTDLTDGGFTAITFNNQDTGSMMENLLTNLDGQTLSVRSTGLNSVGDPAQTAQGEVFIQFTQAAGAASGVIELELGHGGDDRAINDAFSYKNYSSTVDILDAGDTATTLDLTVNTAGLNGTGAAQINVNYGDFLTETDLGSDIGATNTVTIGQTIVSTSSDYSTVAQNALNSTTYDGSTYAGSQNVNFGSATPTTSITGKSYDITTGTAADRVDLSYMTTSTARTAAGFAQSSWLLNTQVALGGGSDELVLGATLADPRNVVTPDVTYDGYFQNWTDIETLTINNRNAINSATVGLDAYAQINNGDLGVVNFTDVSGTLAVGYRFTNDLTVNVDACGGGVNEQALKTTTINSFSEADLVLNVDESTGMTGAAGNELAFTSTGANLGNNVTVNFDNIDASGMTLDVNSMTVTAGSLDVLDFDVATSTGDLASGAIIVTTDNTWTEVNETTTYDFTGIVQSSQTTGNGTITFTAAAESNALGLTILGSTDGGSAALGVDNTITGSDGDDVITSAGYSDDLTGGDGDDQITYTGNSAVATNDVTVDAGAGDDVIVLSAMEAGEDSTVIAGAGDDLVTLSLGDTTYSFADVAVETLASAAVATTAETILNVGLDVISGFNATANDVFEIDTAVFGTDINNAGALASFQRVAATNTILATTTTNAIIAVQSDSGADVGLYYVAPDITVANTSIDILVQAGSAVLIGVMTNVTGLMDTNDFTVV